MSEVSHPLVKYNLLKYLAGSGWDKVLFQYIHSHEFDEVLQELQRLSTAGYKFCPTVGAMWHWMKVTPYDSIRAMMLIDDSHNQLDSVGIPWVQDMSKMSKIETARSNAAKYKGRGKDIRICTRMDIKWFLSELVPDETEYFDYDLTRWCKQGVLMMPYSPTCRIEGKPHYNLWTDFRARIIEMINDKYKDIPVLLVGERCHKYEDLIESRYTLPVTVYQECNHPDWYKIVNEWITGEPIQWT